MSVKFASPLRMKSTHKAEQRRRSEHNKLGEQEAECKRRQNEIKIIESELRPRQAQANPRQRELKENCIELNLRHIANYGDEHEGSHRDRTTNCKFKNG